MRGANDNAEDAGGGPFRASGRALLLPAAATALVYGVPLVALVSVGQGDGAIARLCIVTLGLALPFLLAYALLRWITVHVDAMPHALIVHPGFPSTRRHAIAYSAIRSVEVQRGVGGRLAGTSTLVITLIGGRRICAVDLEDGEAARAAVLARMNLPRNAAAVDPAASETDVPRILAG